MAHVIDPHGVDLGDIQDRGLLAYYQREPGYTVGGVTTPANPARSSADILPVWAANTIYVAGQEILDPTGVTILVRQSTGTSRSTYDSTEQSQWSAAGAGGGGGGGSVAVKDEGTTVVATATAFDFVGAGVTATDGGSGKATVTIPGGSTGLTPTAVKTANYTAAAGDLVPVDTTSGNVTVTLPTAPADKTQVGVKHVIRGGTNTVTIAAAGSDVFNKTGGSTTLTLTLLNQSAVLQKAGGIWYVVSDDLALSQLDARFAALGTTLNDRGAWTTGLVLAVNDTVTYNFSRYVTKTAHTAGASFDPTKFVQTGNLNGRCIRIPDGWGTYWKAARNSAGTAQALVEVVGDSITQGQSASSEAASWLGQFRAAVQTAYGDGGSGLVNIDRVAARGGFVFTGTWVVPFAAQFSEGPGCTNGTYSASSGATATVTGRGTTVEFFYKSYGNSGTGTGTVSIDGGAAVPIAANRADGTTTTKASRYRVTGLSSGSHTLVFTTTNTGGIVIYAARFTNATGVVVDNHGAAGRRSGAACRLAIPTDPSPSLWAGGSELPAHLAVWAFGVNDVNTAYGAITDGATFLSNLAAWAQAVMKAGHGRTDMLIIAPHVGNWASAGDASPYATLVQSMLAAAEMYGAAFVNLWGVAKNSWEWMNDQGYWSDGSASSGASGSDGVHLSNTGHTWWWNQVSPIVLDMATAASMPALTPKPTAILTVSSRYGAGSNTVTLDASGSSTAFPGTITNYAFDPGDGTGIVTQPGATLAHNYTSAGDFTATVVVTNSDGQSATSNPAYTSVAPAGFTGLYDSFDRADETTLTAANSGQTWTQSNIGGSGGTFGVSGLALALTANPGSGKALAYASSGKTDGTFTAIVDTAVWSDVVLRYADANNYVGVWAGGLYKVVGGTLTNVATWGSRLASGGQFDVVISGTSFTVKHNGTTVGSGTIADAALQTSTNYGQTSPFQGTIPFKQLRKLVMG